MLRRNEELGRPYETLEERDIRLEGERLKKAAKAAA
jgi:hypothetical protein